MRFILPLLSILLSSCSQTIPAPSEADKNTHKIAKNQIEAQKAKEEYQKLKSSHH